ncbi:hypothetical protein TorRG33x02_159520 [Trema orientale]|uniref:Uncharacterized protein n=1 Tax=Trema orientale TaxID=63057 RepID=A0A2P5ESB6_TREOI|nr:hypothetical protein TorRG33x02_159520 [Trema orientale]
MTSDNENVGMKWIRTVGDNLTQEFSLAKITTAAETGDLRVLDTSTTSILNVFENKPELHRYLLIHRALIIDDELPILNLLLEVDASMARL